ncbi:MAG TPA: ADOP family duplicated permease [Longimicrobiales bacterium]|nr:ADOP family duplicated permease [Longimicrobiales bacterium]
MSAQPPRWLERVAEWALPAGLSGQGTLGDLAEEFQRRSSRSPFLARLWYAGQTASVLAYRVFTGSGADSQDTHSDMFMDLRWAFRLGLKHPGFALGVVTVLALGLAANVAVYSVVDGTFRNTSWWGEPERTVSVWPEREWSFGMMQIYRDEQAAYRSVGGYAEFAFALRTPDGSSESVNGVVITPELFRELSVQPALGRALDEDDAFLGVEPVAVIGESLWRRSFGADPGVLGSTVDIGGASVRVVGIQGMGGRAPGGRAEVWFPLVMDPRDDDYFKAMNLKMVGVLRDGVTMDDAYAEIDTFNDRLARLFPSFFTPDWDDGMIRVARADASQRRLVSTPLLLLLGGTALLLLITALNVGNLLLGRAIERRGELAVRAAIGAGRGRIVRQLLVEAGVLTVLAVGLGLWAGAVAGPWIAELFVGEAVVTASSVLEPSVLAFAMAAAVGAWVVLGGVPVAYFLRSQRFGLDVRPKSGMRVQQSLVSVQAALATLLLVSATLLVATVGNLRSVPLGFDERDLLTVELSPPEDRVSSAASARGLYDGLAERVAAIPGVEAVGLTAWLPLRAQAPLAPINLETAPMDQAQAARAPLHYVDPGFFRAMDLEPIQGRLLGSEDRKDGNSVVVVNETLADMLWPDGSAIGQRIAIDPHMWDNFLPVVGVVPDIRSGGITGPAGPAMYVSLAEKPTRDVTLLVRTAGGGGGLVPAVRRAVADVDALVPVRSVMWMADVVRAAYSISWVVMGLLVILAALATALGAIGIYAALTQHVASSRREIGVRMALGADPGAVVSGVVRSGLLIAGVGILVGCVAAAVSARVLESMLFGVSSVALWAYVAAAVALGFAALVAGWVPAWRAGRLPPAEVLRSD